MLTAIQLSYLITFITGIILLVLIFHNKDWSKFFVFQELLIAVLLIIDLFHTFSSTSGFMGGLAETGEHFITLLAILVHFVIILIFLIHQARNNWKMGWGKLLLIIALILIVAIYVWQLLIAM